MDISEEVTLNGERVSSTGKITPADVLKAMEIRSSGTGTVFCNGLFKYASSDGETITAIDLPKDNLVANGGTGLHIDDFSHDWSYHNDKTTAVYSSFDLLDGRYSVKTTKNCIRVPGQDMWEKFYEGDVSLNEIESLIYHFNANTTWESNGKKVFNADIYDVDEEWAAGVVVEQITQAASTSPQKELFLVEKMVTGLDKDGIATDYLYGCYKDTYKAFEFDTNAVSRDVYKTLQPGDVLRVSLNGTGKINALFKVFTLKKENKGDYKNGGYLMCGEETDCWGDRDGNLGNPDNYTHDETYSGNWFSMPNVLHARLSKVGGLLGGRYYLEFGYREGQPDNVLDTRLVCCYKDQYIYLFDEATGKARHASNADMDPTNPNQSVVVRARYHGAFEIVIINRAKDPGDMPFVGTFN